MQIFLILFLLPPIFVGAAPKAPVEKMPSCIRPKDFANGRFVASYEGCLKRREVFCEIHKEDKTCLARPKSGERPYFKTTIDDINPSQRCKIEKDDSYKCLQDPIRIIPTVETTSAPPPSGSANPSPSPSENGENANGETATPQPVVMPPPPPHPH